MSLILELINYLMVCQIWSLTAHKKVETLLFCIMAKPGKIIECSVTKVYKRTRYKRGSSIDRISTLPDDVLVLILSSLPVKEAVATSILSSRWRYLWTFITKLDFDGTSSMVKLIRDKHLSTLRREFIYLRDYDLRLDKMRLDYVDWVNRVIALHKRPEIEEFRVFFDLTKTYQNTIDEWVRFALTKNVQKLELNLTPEPSSRGLFNNYTLDPYNLLWADKGSFYDSIDHLKYLKKIILCHVNVNGEALAFFLCNCPLLQHLSISGSDHFSTLKIIGPHPSFKCLEIEFCSSLRSVEIRDLNLVYFKYVGFQAHFVVEKLPLLVEMYFGGMCWNMRDILLPFSSYIAQLEILTLDTVGKPCYDVVREFSSSMKMSNLKQLTIKTRIDYDDSLIHLTELLQASPLLQRFVLEATHHEKSRNVWPLFMSVMGASSYSQLKEIQFVGYEGGPSELELLTHFLDNVVALERLLVDTRKPIKSWQYLCRTYCATCETKLKEIEVHARSRAKKELPIKVPRKVNLKIL